ncbi:Zinc finger BED domain-containing protein RICESLEEPER 2 [Linum perenne]
MFTLMMKTANPLYQRIRRSTTTGDIFSTYDIFKGKVKELLKHVQRMSLTTDMWTSNQTMQYMVVTGHFIDKNWKLQKRILNFFGVPPPHTGIVLAGALHKCLVDWDVEAKIWSITLDNASNNDVVVHHLKSMLTYTRRLPLDGDLFHVRCGAHIINIMVQYGLKEIEDTIESVRQSVKHIAASESRISMFRDIAKQLRLSPKKLILDCSTRWNSTHHMLSVALELKAVFPQYAAQESGYKWLPSDEDWSKVSKVCKFLGLFSYITTIISGSSYPTINLLLPELWNIKTLLNETMESEDERMKVMASKMLEKFDKYWGACNLLITIATILDPRNKFRFVEVSFKDLYSEDNYYTNVNLVREKLYALYNEYVEEYKERNIDSQSEEGGGATTTSGTTTSVLERTNTGRAKFDSIVQSGENSSALQNELDAYLDAKLEKIKDPEFNVIDWWKSERTKYKILSKMACEIMAIPITSVASESAFSAGDRVIDPSRSSLGQKTIEALLCSQDWLRNHYGLTSGSKVSFFSYFHNCNCSIQFVIKSSFFQSTSTTSMEAEVEIDLS